MRGHEIPIGLVLALRAAQIVVKWIAVITDANHHTHPMSAALDWINPAYWGSDREELFHIDDTRVLIAHALITEGRKNWTAALERLLA